VGRVPDDFDWEALARQFGQPDDETLMNVVSMIGRAQARYMAALREEGLDPLTSLKIASLTIREIGQFARDTLPVLTQQFINWNDKP
jgi:hypothetical protein